MGRGLRAHLPACVTSKGPRSTEWVCLDTPPAGTSSSSSSSSLSSSFCWSSSFPYVTTHLPHPPNLPCGHDIPPTSFPLCSSPIPSFTSTALRVSHNKYVRHSNRPRCGPDGGEVDGEDLLAGNGARWAAPLQQQSGGDSGCRGMQRDGHVGLGVELRALTKHGRCAVKGISPDAACFTPGAKCRVLRVMQDSAK
ncbi:hypothetical protein E2C01_037193 [Portunus trituberculatus]|uniref:Uncharacterized protein n=1 Tax=Portunus trituberculatus TaxID=210409 RepID=A0A5B7FGF0_PORTR|nr:hypothetical protein [Portunus trituberculatus]